jgi:tetratricopeptide (TPR) repeat protein
VLDLQQPPAALPITTAIWRFARAASLAAQGELEKAVQEQAEFRNAVKAVPEGAMMAMNPAATVLQIAELTLDGEIAFRRGEINTAVTRLTEAVSIEDTLSYIEPPDWVQPVRHSLGAILLFDERYDDAAAVYRADLERWPENGWALWGLAKALKAKGSPEAASVQARFDKAWEHADTKIHATCLCIPPGE